MENAGLQVARCAGRLLRAPGRVTVVCGHGNNGGDGLVAARHLRRGGHTVRTVLIGDEGSLSDLVAGRLAVLRHATAEVTVAATFDATALLGADLVIDALLGVGLRSDPRGAYAAAIEAMSGHTVLSIDVPSGLDSDTGTAYRPCVQAAATCTLGAVKRGMWASRRRCGRLFVAGIGIPGAAWAAVGITPPRLVGDETLHEVSEAGSA